MHEDYDNCELEEHIQFHNVGQYEDLLNLIINGDLDIFKKYVKENKVYIHLFKMDYKYINTKLYENIVIEYRKENTETFVEDTTFYCSSLLNYAISLNRTDIVKYLCSFVDVDTEFCHNFSGGKLSSFNYSVICYSKTKNRDACKIMLQLGKYTRDKNV